MKDASSAAIYGSRAANGVVIITTKQGKEGDLKVKFDSQLTLSWLPRYDLMDAETYKIYNDRAYDEAILAGVSGVTKRQNHYDGNTDWQDEMLGTGVLQNYNVSLSGGSKTVKYYASLNRMVDDGALYRTGYDKYGFRINTSGQKGIFSYGENFYYTKSDRKILNGNPWSDFIGMPPTIPVYDESHVGGYGYGDVDRANSYGLNSVAMQDLYIRNNEEEYLTGNIYGQISLFGMFDAKLNINASGKVENVQIDAKADVAVAGSTTEAVKVTVNAKNTTIKAETPIDTTLNADTKLDLSKGAEGSTVTTAENVKADVANNTTDKVSVKDSTGKETTVDAGKTETKTDDGKKDDEKKDNQKTDDNSGTVTPAPIPLRISSAMVCSSTEVRVYFNQTVPNEIATDQVVITGKAGNVVSVESVDRGEPDTQAYFVTLSDVLKDGKYQVELTISNQKFVTSFLYDETVWAPLDAALKIVNEEFKKTHTVSVSGLESAEICRQAFEKNLMAAINNDTEAKKVQVEVETRDFEYEPDEGETIADNHKKVCIWIGLYMGESTKYMTDEFVDFECTGAAIEAKAPEIIGVTKTSIIVKAEKGQEYIALDKNADISKVDDESWYGFDRADSNGNIEIKELESDITYVVYTRIHGLSPKAAENEISLSKAEGVFVVFKN